MTHYMLTSFASTQSLLNTDDAGHEAFRVVAGTARSASETAGTHTVYRVEDDTAQRVCSAVNGHLVWPQVAPALWDATEYTAPDPRHFLTARAAQVAKVIAAEAGLPGQDHEPCPVLPALTDRGDLLTRWLPDPEAVRQAVAVLALYPGQAVLAAVPMYQPGKTHGIWTTGQEVVTVPGAVFTGLNAAGAGAGEWSYAWARDNASMLAAAELGKCPGTYGWATVCPDGTAAVFEDGEVA